MKKLKLLSLALLSATLLSFSSKETKYIVIDAGHGGADHGAKRESIIEKDITLEIAKRIKEESNNQVKYEVILTRDADHYISLQDRAEIMNKLNPDMVISLHLNSTPTPETSKSGQEIFTQENDASRILAEKIAAKFDSRIIYEQNLHLLKNCKAPTVLVELGFINNTEDRKLLTSKEGQADIAKKFVEVISEN